MLKIGLLDTGNLLVEMTVKEWEQIQQGESIVDDLVAWKQEFRQSLSSLQLCQRTYMLIARCANLSDYRKEHKPSAELFIRKGRLLSFPEWCTAFMAGTIDCKMVKNFGKGMDAELRQAIENMRLREQHASKD